MSQTIVFADVLDTAEQLDTEAQSELVAILSRRLAARGRERVITAMRRWLDASSLPVSATR